MFMIEYKDIGWWYWLVTAGLLTYGISGGSIPFIPFTPFTPFTPFIGFALAIGLTIFQLFHFVIREKSITAFPVQVRFWYLVLLVIALPAPLQFIFWLPLIGTWAQVIFGYCAMARTVSLLPWNRTDAFSISLLRETFFSKPVRGNIQQGFAGPEYQSENT